MNQNADERRVFDDFLRKRSLKVTRERTALFDEIFSTHRHFDAEDLVIRMRDRGTKVSRATIYRTLELLHECGLVGRVRLNEEKYRYERLRKGEHHDHLVCSNCGKVIEFIDAAIEKRQEAVCREYDFAATSHSHQIRGICSACRKSAAKTSARAAGAV
ncbi:MAG: transcriptional repressor [Thermoanaerobaculia bacterium]|nr:transcriptional repressor [Thermoanaerobaculia bacterium]